MCHATRTPTFLCYYIRNNPCLLPLPHFAIWRVRSRPSCSRKSWFTLAPLRRFSQSGFPLRVPVSVASATVDRRAVSFSPLPSVAVLFEEANRVPS